MRTIAVPARGTWPAWRDAARGLAAAGVPPEDVLWTFGGAASDFFADAPAPVPTGTLTVPKSFVALAETVICHRDPERFARLYALLCRLRAAPGLMGDRGDPAVARLREMEKSVRRDKHKMTAFLRFREIDAAAPPRRRFAAWFEPQHHITEPIARTFFARRFGDMDWIIVTPDLTAHFEGGALTFTDGQTKPPLPEDATEALWTTYFRNIFNPARVKLKAMQAEMPKKYWKNMPETRAIPDLIAQAEARARQMQEAAPTLPPIRAERIAARARQEDKMDLFAAADAPSSTADFLRQLKGCERCGLYANATQVVPGEGPPDAPLMVVGEQPGDQEDLAGRPFVGPAGQLFDQIAGEAGLDRSKVYVTNAVKHFKFTPRGKRRIHQRPETPEIEACRWWLTAERAFVNPDLILAMGATAAASLTGTGQGITKRRGRIEQAEDGTPVLLTWHPSYLLRVPNEAARESATREFREDLRLAAERLG